MIRIRSRLNSAIISRISLLFRWREFLPLSRLLVTTTCCSPCCAGMPEWAIHCVAHSVVPALLAYVRMPMSTDIRTGTTLGAVSVFEESWTESGVAERTCSTSSAYPEHVIWTDISFVVVMGDGIPNSLFLEGIRVQRLTNRRDVIMCGRWNVAGLNSASAYR